MHSCILSICTSSQTLHHTRVDLLHYRSNTSMPEHFRNFPTCNFPGSQHSITTRPTITQRYKQPTSRPHKLATQQPPLHSYKARPRGLPSSICGYSKDRLFEPYTIAAAQRPIGVVLVLVAIHSTIAAHHPPLSS